MTSSVQRVLVVYGTRPELIKLAPLIDVLRATPDRFRLAVCSSGQHRELVQDLEELFEVVPDHRLDLMRPGQSLNELGARGMRRMDELLSDERPDWTIVQGDTTTAMVTALTAFQLGLRTGHVEAGLRTGDLRAPFPEEANRRIIDQIADLLFAPTSGARETLIAEGHDSRRVHLTGNTGIDALRRVADGLVAEDPADEVLITVHRRESLGEPLEDILAALRELAVAFPSTRWTLPVHRNPRVSEPVEAALSGLPNLELLPPLRYDQLVRLLRRVRFVLTDSGGLQEEAPFFGKPVLVLRDKTERPEGIAAGVARLVGTSRQQIVAAATGLLTDQEVYEAMARGVSPYGDGHASERIARLLAGDEIEPFAG